MRVYHSPSSKNTGIYKTSTGVINNLPQNVLISNTSKQSNNKIPNTITYQKSIQFNNNQVSFTVDKLGYLQSQKNNIRPFMTEQQMNNKLFYKDQYLHNQKACTFDNQDHYIGQWIQNKQQGKQKPHGYGVYKFTINNLQYRGYFKNGLMDGTGTLQKIQQKGKHNIIYEGQWAQGQKHGKGKYIYDEKTQYNGYWNKNKKSGKGIFKSNQGIYEGFWLNDKKHGKGILKLNNGPIYEGDWQQDQFINGQVKYVNGDKYIGNLHNFQRQGSGTYIPVNQQEIYRGQWSKNKRQGNAQIIYQNGQKYFGPLVNNNRQGNNCVYEWKNDTKVICTFENNVPSYGKMIEPNNKSFDFNFKYKPK